MTTVREKTSFRLPPQLARQLDIAARARRVPRTAIVEAALASYLSADAPERLEAALTRRLDRMTRQLNKLQWHADLTNETLALFIRFWLTSNPPLPEQAMRAAQAMGKERWSRFIDSLTRRMEQGPRLGQEIAIDIGDDSKSNIVT